MSFFGIDFATGPDISSFWTLDSNRVVFCGPVQYAMLKAHIDNQHRDRRRIKREVNKAARKARKQQLEAQRGQAKIQKAPP